MQARFFDLNIEEVLDRDFEMVLTDYLGMTATSALERVRA